MRGIPIEELSLFNAAGGWGLEGIVGPGMFGVPAFQFFFDCLIAGGPKTGEVLSDLDGAFGWREQMNENRDSAIDQAGSVALSE